MSSLFTFKRNMALLIFLAFTVRIFIVNMCLGNPAETIQVKNGKVSTVSTVVKKRRWNAELVATTAVDRFATTDVFEEDTDGEDDVVKASSPASLSLLYSLVVVILRTPESNNSFDSAQSDLFPKKYLAFSILRI